MTLKEILFVGDVGWYLLILQEKRQLNQHSVFMSLCFYTLGFKQSHCYIRNENKKVIKFHEKMGAEIVCNNTLNTFFIYKKNFLNKL